MRDARDASGDVAVMDQQVRFDARGASLARCSSKPTSFCRAPRCSRMRRLRWPTKNGLSIRSAQPARFEGIGETVGVLADDDVALLQSQQALRLDAEGADAGRAPAS